VISSYSGIVLIWDSSDCADTTRSFGGGLRSGGVGELGWLRYGDTSTVGQHGPAAGGQVHGYLLAT
jgi:hypothetical protein